MRGPHYKVDNSVDDYESHSKFRVAQRIFANKPVSEDYSFNRLSGMLMTKLLSLSITF